MSPNQRANVLCGAACFLFAAFYFYLTVNLTTAAMLIVTQISAKFVPKILAGLIAGLSVLLIIATLLEPAPAAGSESSIEAELVDNRAFYGTAAVAFLSLLLWYGIGFFSVPFLIGGTMFVNHKKNLLQIVCIALVTTLILYGVFFKIFDVPLPLGLLE
jgi:hypothetical protein